MPLKNKHGTTYTNPLIPIISTNLLIIINILPFLKHFHSTFIQPRCLPLPYLCHYFLHLLSISLLFKYKKKHCCLLSLLTAIMLRSYPYCTSNNSLKFFDNFWLSALSTINMFPTLSFSVNFYSCSPLRRSFTSFQNKFLFIPKS